MIVTTSYAVVSEEKIVENFICDDYTFANQVAHASYGDDAFAFESTQYPIQIGDLYENGNVYRINEETGDRIEIKRMPTDTEEIQKFIAENESLTLTLAEMIGGVA